MKIIPLQEQFLLVNLPGFQCDAKVIPVLIWQHLNGLLNRFVLFQLLLRNSLCTYVLLSNASNS